MITCLRLLAVLSVTIGFLLVTNSAKTHETTNFGYCKSDPGSSPVYFSKVIDVGTTGMIDTNPVQNEFNEYLLGRFEYKTNSAFGAQCTASAYTMQQGITMRRDYENQLRQSNKQCSKIQTSPVLHVSLGRRYLLT